MTNKPFAFGLAPRLLGKLGSPSGATTPWCGGVGYPPKPTTRANSAPSCPQTPADAELLRLCVRLAQLAAPPHPGTPAGPSSLVPVGHVAFAPGHHHWRSAN